MKNKIFFSLTLNALFLGSVVYANSVLAHSVQNQWHSVIGVGGGISVPTHLGSAQFFPIINPESDEYFNYSSQNTSQAKGLFEVFLGKEHSFFSNWLLQGGVAYTQAGSYKIKGDFTQGVDEQSADQYTYQFNTLTRQVLAQVKLMRPWHDKFYPYALLGLGVSFNSSSNFSTNVPSFLTLTREYKNKELTNFAYRVGVGFDVDIAQRVRLGVGYRFVDLGGISLGSGSINNISVPGTLSQLNLYTNEALIQLTYII